MELCRRCRGVGGGVVQVKVVEVGDVEVKVGDVKVKAGKGGGEELQLFYPPLKGKFLVLQNLGLT